MSSFAEVRATDDKSATDGKSSSWPNGEPQKIRDAYDAKTGRK